MLNLSVKGHGVSRCVVCDLVPGSAHSAPGSGSDGRGGGVLCFMSIQRNGICPDVTCQI